MVLMFVEPQLNKLLLTKPRRVFLLMIPHMSGVWP
jgi:hypothetical protein